MSDAFQALPYQERHYHSLLEENGLRGRGLEKLEISAVNRHYLQRGTQNFKDVLMVKLSKLYTRAGDAGETGLVGGKRVPKASPQVHAYGDIDELNSWIGMVRSLLQERKLFEDDGLLHDIQQELFDIGAELATPQDSDWQPPTTISEFNVTSLENQIDRWTAVVPELKSFLLPGGSPLTSAIHIARTVCRRAERSVVSYAQEEHVRPTILVYLNRLSDWLFAFARHCALVTGEPEHLWDSARSLSKS